MKKKINFIKFIRVWGIIFLMGLGIFFISIDVFYSHRDFNSQAEQIRSTYIDRKKQLIRQEVIYVVDMIRYRRLQSEELTRKKIKYRVYEAYSIARHVYEQNRNTESNAAIQKMVLNALRPIRFENGSGYYFATRLDGFEMLFADRPGMEGLNLLNMQDTRGKYVIKDMIEIAKQSNEGFYEYHWTKPGSEKRDFKKISFIKRFEPWDWFIGTGLYVDDIEAQITEELLSFVSRIRYGKEGYIFVNRLNGDALVSNGKIFSGTQKLWEEFNDDPDKMRKIFELEYQAALKPEGDYIQYSHIKLSSPQKESPKISFILGMPEFQWIVGSGVYLDDVEDDISLMQSDLNKQIRAKIFYFSLTVIIVVGLFYLYFDWLNHRLKEDIDLFISFFKRALHSDEEVDRKSIKFVELDQIAEYANKMSADRILAAKSLKESEHRFRQVYDNIAVGIAQVSLDFRIESANRSYCEMLGCQENELIGKHLKDITHPEVLEENLSQQFRLASGEIDHYRMEKRFVHKDGRTIHGILDANLIRDLKRNPQFFIGSVLDITDRKQAEEELKLSQERMQAILEASPDPVVVYDDVGCATFLNPAFNRLFGWSNDELIGRPIPFVPEEQREITQKTIAQLLQNGGRVSLETKRLTKDGRQLDVIVSAAVISDERGHSVGIVVNLTDLSNIRKMEAQMRQSQKMESVGRLAGGVAHDFNNMLSVIIGYSDMALEEVDLDPPLSSALHEIRKAAQRSANLTRQLLAFARQQTIAPKVLDLNGTVEGMLKMLRRLIGEDIDLAWLPGASLWPVKLDPSQVDQIMANLCVNARDAIEGGGKVTIETENLRFDAAYCADHPGFVEGDYVLLAVSDSGCGMDRETLQNVFEPFFTTKTEGRGTGLGLATVYGIVKQNNGFVTAYSEPGRGTTFKIYLPRHRSAHERLRRRGPERPMAHGHETILLVEDEAAILKMTTMMLEQLGYRVLAAQSPGDALRMAEAHAGRIDMLMTDVVMPELDGRGLADRLSSLYPGLRCLFMSGYTANVIAHRGILDPGVHYIQKPFSKNDLAVKVRAVLERSTD